MQEQAKAKIHNKIDYEKIERAWWLLIINVLIEEDNISKLEDETGL